MKTYTQTTWTPTPPTAPGWYWHAESRLSDRSIVRGDRGAADGIPTPELAGVWAGPIEPPAAWETPTD